MSNVDRDVAAMLQSLKKYDKLTESVAPVLGMKTLGEKDEGKHNNATTGFKAVASKAAKEYGSKEAGDRVAGAARNKMKASGKIKESVDAETIQDLATRMASGELDYDGFKDELRRAEMYDTSMRQGEMGMMGDDTPAGHRAWENERDEWDALDRLERDYDPDEEVDESIDKEDVKESMDKDILEWMNRFAALGKMTGYGK